MAPKLEVLNSAEHSILLLWGYGEWVSPSHCSSWYPGALLGWDFADTHIRGRVSCSLPWIWLHDFHVPNCLYARPFLSPKKHAMSPCASAISRKVFPGRWYLFTGELRKNICKLDQSHVKHSWKPDASRVLGRDQLLPVNPNTQGKQILGCVFPRAHNKGQWHPTVSPRNSSVPLVSSVLLTL